MPPVPKREDMRRNRNTRPADHAETDEVGVPAPPLGPGFSPLGVDFYESLVKSPQSQFFTHSDWYQARLGARLLSDYEAEGKVTLIQQFNALSVRLLTTEGDRRRHRLELEKADKEPGQGWKVAEYRKRLGVA